MPIADGFVTWEEVQAYRNGQQAKLRAAVFDRMDTNHDGSISRAEFDAARDGFGRRDGRPGPDGGPPPPGGPDGSQRGGFGMRRLGMGGFGPGRGHGMGGFGMRGGGEFGPEMFERADANRDGRISLAEAEALPLKMFDRLDANHDGTITPDERKQAREAMRGRWQGRDGRGGPPPMGRGPGAPGSWILEIFQQHAV